MEADITITNKWQKLSDLTGLPVGTATELQYRGGPYQHVVFREGDEPVSNSLSGSRLDYTTPLVTILAGSEEYWLRLRKGFCQLHWREV